MRNAEGQSGDGGWPPPPNYPVPISGPRRVKNRWPNALVVGQVSLWLSGIGTLCWAKDALTDDLGGFSLLWQALSIGGLILLGLGLVIGIAGWRSGTGKVAIALALGSPFWIWLSFHLHPFGTIH